jgi:hypothetical protein
VAPHPPTPRLFTLEGYTARGSCGFNFSAAGVGRGREWETGVSWSACAEPRIIRIIRTLLFEI